MLQLLKQQEADAKHKEHLKKLETDRMLREGKFSDDRMEELRLIRRLQREKEEREFHDNLAHEEKRKQMASSQRNQEERLALQLQKQKQDTVRTEKIRQQLRQNCPELRELESKLKLAYINKERCVQLEEKAALRELERIQNTEYAKQMEKQLEEAELKEKRKKEIQFLDKKKYHKELDDQVEEHDQRHQEKYLEFLEEKLLIDEIVKKVLEEDMKEAQKRWEEQQKYIESIKKYEEDKLEWKIQEQLKKESESKEIQQYLAVLDTRAREQKELREFRIEVRRKIQDELTEMLEMADVQKIRDEIMRTELAIEEREEAERRMDKERQERRMKQQQELQDIYQMQMWLKTQRLEQEKREVEEFRKKMLEKLADDDRISMLTAEKRRLKQTEHRRAVQQMIEERRLKQLAVRRQEMEEYLQEQEMERCRQKIIEEERQRLLHEHAQKLLGFLPKGVVKNELDLKDLGENFQDYYTRKDEDEEDA